MNFNLTLPRFGDLYDGLKMRDLVRQIEQTFARINMARSYADVYAEIAITGTYAGQPASIYNLMGRRTSWVNTTTQHDVADFLTSQMYPTITGAEAWEVVSSSANDTAAGTGAQTVHIAYLNTAGVLQEKTGIALNGVTPVSITFTGGCSAIQWMEVASVGSDGIAAGNIDLRAVTGSVVHERVSSGGNRSLSARFTVPAACTVYMTEWDVSANQNQIDFRLRAQSDMFDGALSGPYLFQDIALCPSGVSRDSMQLRWRKVAAGGTIKISAIPASTAANVRGDTSVVIVCMEN